jgi:hypothetical protein
MVAPDRAFTVGEHIDAVACSRCCDGDVYGTLHSHSLLRGDRSHWACREGAHEMVLRGSRAGVMQTTARSDGVQASLRRDYRCFGDRNVLAIAFH